MSQEVGGPRGLGGSETPVSGACAGFLSWAGVRCTGTCVNTEFLALVFLSCTWGSQEPVCLTDGLGRLPSVSPRPLPALSLYLGVPSATPSTPGRSQARPALLAVCCAHHQLFTRIKDVSWGMSINSVRRVGGVLCSQSPEKDLGHKAMLGLRLLRTPRRPPFPRACS